MADIITDPNEVDIESLMDAYETQYNKVMTAIGAEPKEFNRSELEEATYKGVGNGYDRDSGRFFFDIKWDMEIYPDGAVYASLDGKDNLLIGADRENLARAPDGFSIATDLNKSPVSITYAADNFDNNGNLLMGPAPDQLTVTDPPKVNAHAAADVAGETVHVDTPQADAPHKPNSPRAGGVIGAVAMSVGMGLTTYAMTGDAEAASNVALETALPVNELAAAENASEAITGVSNYYAGERATAILTESSEHYGQVDVSLEGAGHLAAGVVLNVVGGVDAAWTALGGKDLVEDPLREVVVRPVVEGVASLFEDEAPMAAATPAVIKQYNDALPEMRFSYAGGLEIEDPNKPTSRAAFDIAGSGIGAAVTAGASLVADVVSEASQATAKALPLNK